MPTPKEQLICERILARLQLIKTANGYNYEVVNARIAIWETNRQADEGVAISIFTGEVGSIESPESRRKTLHELPVIIEATLPETFATPAGAWNMIADIKKAIRGTDANSNRTNQYLSERWPAVEGVEPGAAWTTKEVAHSIIKQADSFEIIGAQVRIAVVYETEKFNSYA